MAHPERIQFGLIPEQGFQPLYFLHFRIFQRFQAFPEFRNGKNARFLLRGVRFRFCRAAASGTAGTSAFCRTARFRFTSSLYGSRPVFRQRGGNRSAVSYKKLGIFRYQRFFRLEFQGFDKALPQLVHKVQRPAQKRDIPPDRTAARQS